MSHIDRFGVVTVIESCSGCLRGLDEPLTAEDEWIDVGAAVERDGCTAQTILRRIQQGGLPARNERVSGRDGRPLIKTLIRVSDLNDAFGWAAREKYVRKIGASARPLTTEQKSAIRQVFLDHLLNREVKVCWDQAVRAAVESRLNGESLEDSTAE